MNALLQALGYAEQGCYLFPVAAGYKGGSGKYPAGSWKETSTTDLEQIKAWGHAFPDCNWGMDCGKSNICVIDVDCKPGQVGYQTYQKILQENNQGELQTRTHKTSGNGLQFLFRGAISAAKTLGQNVDVKSIGGYVVMPGSTTIELKENGALKQMAGEYTICNPVDIAPLPDWVRDLASKKEAFTAETIVGDIEHGSRNNMLASFGGTMRARGANFETIEAALLAMNETQTDEPLPPEEVTAIAHSVARYEPDQAVSVAEFMKFEEISQQEGNSGWLAARQESDLVAPDWQIKGRLVPGYITVTGAPPGVGKSRIAMLEAMAVATGKPLTGMPVRKMGHVWYISEDPLDDLFERAMGICKANGLDNNTLPLLLTSLMRMPMRVLKMQGNSLIRQEHVIEHIRNTIRTNHIKLVILDPYTRLHDCPENDNTACNAVCEILQQIAAEFGCSIHIVHHASKSCNNALELRGNMNALRGASALAGAARIVWTVDHYCEKFDGKKYVVPIKEAKDWIRLDPAKCNIAKVDPENISWFHLDSVRLPCHKYAEDSVGVATSKRPPEFATVQSYTEYEPLVKIFDKIFSKEMVNSLTVNKIAIILFRDYKTSDLFKTGVLAALNNDNSIYRFLKANLNMIVTFSQCNYSIDSSKTLTLVRNNDSNLDILASVLN